MNTTPFCEDCKTQFTTINHFKRHLLSNSHKLRTSSEKNNLAFCSCSKSFTTRSALYRHRKNCSVYINVKENPTEIYQLREEIHSKEEQNKILEKELSNQIVIKRGHTNKRNKICQRVRKEIISEQNDKCNTCMKELTEFNVNIDHKIGVQFGGTNDIDNLQALCLECHSEKTIKEIRKRKKIFDAIQQILSE